MFSNGQPLSDILPSPSPNIGHGSACKISLPLVVPFRSYWRSQLKNSIDVLDGRVQLSTTYKPINIEICFLMKKPHISLEKPKYPDNLRKTNLVKKPRIGHTDCHTVQFNWRRRDNIAFKKICGVWTLAVVTGGHSASPTRRRDLVIDWLLVATYPGRWKFIKFFVNFNAYFVCSVFLR